MNASPHRHFKPIVESINVDGRRGDSHLPFIDISRLVGGIRNPVITTDVHRLRNESSVMFELRSHVTISTTKIIAIQPDTQCTCKYIWKTEMMRTVVLTTTRASLYM